MKPVLSMKTPGGSMHFRHSMTLYAVSLALLAVIPQPASADSTTLYTTTSDFDGGDKSASPIWFANNGVDQPMYNFINQPQAVYSAMHRKTYVAYFGEDDGYGSVLVTYYDHRTELWVSSVNVFSTADLDGHKNPAIWPMSNGKILLVGGSHDTGLQAWRTLTTNGEIASWEQLGDIDTLTTYPTLFEYPTGTMWAFYRSGSFNPVSYRKSTNFGTSWTAETTFINMAPDGLYYGKWDIIGNRLYFPWTMVLTANTSFRQDIYVCYLDLANGNTYALNGTLIGTGITSKAQANSYCRVVDQAGNNMNNMPSIDVLSASSIYMIYPEATPAYNATDWHLRFTRWNGTAWAAPDTIVDPIGASSSFSDLSMTSDTNGEAFVTTIGVPTGCSGDCDYTGDMERWSWNGTAWSFVETILSQAKAGDTVSHPYYVWNGRPEMRVVFDQFIYVPSRKPGDQKLYAWGSNGFVGRSDLADGLPGVSTITDNKYVADGSFTLSNPRHEPFTTNDSDAENWHWRFLQTEDGNNDCVYGTSGGVFAVNWTSGGGTGRRACGLRGQFGITGDFDVRLKTQMTDANTGGSMFALLNVLDVPFIGISGTSQAATADGIQLQKFYGTFDLVRSHEITAGMSAQLGTDTTSASNPEWLRITRTGTSWETFVSTDGSSWTSDETTTGVAGKVYVSFGYAANSVFSGSSSLMFDQFDIATGTIDSDGYRKVGSWRTSEIPSSHATGEIARNITVTYSASVDGYIDSVAVVDADDGEVLWENTTDVTAGSSVFYDLGGDYSIETDLIGHDFKVRVTLAGNGETSAMVTSVTLATARASSLVFLDSAINIFWLIFFACTLAAIFATAWYVKEWRGV